ncbi:MAG: c-type cytochrome, partial [Gammaproteobacteria bacterium]|nr:c-type cytochrome [Gammaproteobacteria bacterium]
YDAALVEAGAARFAAQCGFCHGRDAAGGTGGSDLTRSELVAADIDGRAIAEVIRQGRVDLGMPAFAAMPDDDVDAIVAFIYDRQAYAATVEGGRRSVDVTDLATGDAAAGRRFFDRQCSQCHSATGDLGGIANRIDGLRLLQRMLYPRPGPDSVRGQTIVSVTTAAGESLSGPLAYEDDFVVALTDADGRYRSFTKRQIDYTIDNPLEGHLELLDRYTDEAMHDVLAYLHTLR